MMSDLRELYQEVIVDHNRNPRNFGRPEGTNREAQGYNPLCGDKVTVYLRVENGVVADAAFEGSGCAISTASASLMTEAQHLFEDFHGMVAGSGSHPDLGKLEVLSGVREFPARIKCATLAWHTLDAALKGKGEPVKTE
jgi:nitrogen fixation protein NifU and related proteins